MSNRQEAKAPSSAHNNADLLIWSAFLLGAHGKWIDVEDLYLKAFELAPARLSWRTRAEIPDYKKCAKALQELEDPNRSEHLGLLSKQGSYQRKLTEKGYMWCKQYESHLSGLYSGNVVPAALNQESSRIIRQIETSEVFKRFTGEGILSIDIWEIAEAMRCMPDSTLSVWADRIDAVLIAAKDNNRPEIEVFALKVRERVFVEKVEGSK
jgi:hypothetical protein